MPPLPIGSAGLVARGMTKLMALVARVQLDQLGRLRRSPPVRPTQHLPVRLQRGRQGLDRPDPLAECDRQGRAARDWGARPPHRDRRQGPRHWRDSIDIEGAEHFQPAKVVVVAANAIGTPWLLLSASPAHPDGLVNSSGLVGKRLMMHPFANVAGLFEDPLMSWQGQFGTHRVARVL